MQENQSKSASLWFYAPEYNAAEYCNSLDNVFSMIFMMPNQMRFLWIFLWNLKNLS